MIFGAFVTLAVLDSMKPVEQVPRGVRRPAAIAARRPHVDSSDLYSLRARRRFASYLRLRLLELREANLERAAAAIERRLPLSALIPGGRPDP